MNNEEISPALRPPIRVAIVEDQRIAREGLRLIIDGTPGYRCAHAFETVEDALRGLVSEVPDVLLLDIHLPGMSGAEGVHLFREKYPTLRVVMLTYLSDDDNVFQSICSGACGYVLKKTPPAEILEAVSDAHQGGSCQRHVDVGWQHLGATDPLVIAGRAD